MTRIISYLPRKYEPVPPPKRPKCGVILFFFAMIAVAVGIYAANKYYKAGSNETLSDINQGVIPVAEAKKSERILAQAVDNPEYQPVRNNEIPDLVIPNAHAFAVIDADTGKILVGNGETDRRQIASLTKMMTAVLIVEKINNLDETVTISEEEIYVEGTKIGCPRSGFCNSPRLQAGEEISARNLLQAMLMNSANDAAIALGKYISGSQEAFTELMNEKAAQMELTDTRFCTPSGLELDGRESECYSSAADIARIAAYSMRYPEIWKMFGYPTNSKITSRDGRITHTLINSDKAQGEIPGALGGKTGFTPAAGYSLLMGANDRNNKHRIIAVLLDDPYRWQDIRAAINWTFQSYSWKPNAE